MKHLLILSSLLCFIVACQPNESQSTVTDSANMTPAEIEEILEQTQIVYGNPIYADSSDFILIPITHDLNYDKKHYASIKSDKETLPAYWNIVFYNKKSGKTHLLSQDKIRIQHIYIQESHSAVNHQTLPNTILYEIGEEPIKKDMEASTSLYASNLDGSNFKAVSPRGESLIYFEIMPQSQHIFMQTLRDTNNDSILNQSDKRILYKATLNKNEWQINELIPAESRTQIENLYLNQWAINP